MELAKKLILLYFAFFKACIKEVSLFILLNEHIPFRSLLVMMFSFLKS